MSLDFSISHRPDFAMVTVRLPAGGKVQAESSAMATMDPTLTMKAGFKGGLLSTIGRGLAGENIIINTFTAVRGAGEVSFAPGQPGDVIHYPLDGQLMLQRGAFLASDDGIKVTGSWQGAKGFFSGNGLVLLKAEGKGDLFFNSYGAILDLDVGEEGLIVDTGYVVAFEPTLDYHVRVLPGLGVGGKIKSFLFGGEGLVCQFNGRGKVWVQTRQVPSFVRWVWPFRPAKSND